MSRFRVNDGYAGYKRQDVASSGPESARARKKRLEEQDKKILSDHYPDLLMAVAQFLKEVDNDQAPNFEILRSAVGRIRGF